MTLSDKKKKLNLCDILDLIILATLIFDVLCDVCVTHTAFVVVMIRYAVALWITWKAGTEARESVTIRHHVSATCLFMHVLPLRFDSVTACEDSVRASTYQTHLKHYVLVPLSEPITVIQQRSQLQQPSQLICTSALETLVASVNTVQNSKLVLGTICVNNRPNFSPRALQMALIVLCWVTEYSGLGLPPGISLKLF